MKACAPCVRGNASAERHTNTAVYFYASRFSEAAPISTFVLCISEDAPNSTDMLPAALRRNSRERPTDAGCSCQARPVRTASPGDAFQEKARHLFSSFSPFRVESHQHQDQCRRDPHRNFRALRFFSLFCVPAYCSLFGAKLGLRHVSPTRRVTMLASILSRAQGGAAKVRRPPPCADAMPLTHGGAETPRRPL